MSHEIVYGYLDVDIMNLTIMTMELKLVKLD
jgi:hypothetical protein